MVQTAPYCAETGSDVLHPECVLPFDPEGILTTFGAVFPCQAGLFAALGFSLNNDRLRYQFWSVTGIGMVIVGGFVDICGWRFNKQLWSLSYSFFTSGICCLTLLFLYEVLDRTQRAKTLCMPLVWVGSNAILVFVFAATGALEALLVLVYIDDRSRNIVAAYDNAVLSVDSTAEKRAGHVLLTCSKILFWVVSCCSLCTYMQSRVTSFTISSLIIRPPNTRIFIRFCF